MFYPNLMVLFVSNLVSQLYLASNIRFSEVPKHGDR